jgi:phosphatidylglycerol lysyltransferase
LVPTPEDVESAISLIRAHGRDPIALNVLCADKGIFWCGAEGIALVQRVRDSLIVFPDPVVTDPAHTADLLTALHDHANEEDLDLAFYQVSADWIPHLHDFGHHFFKLGEEGVVPLTGFTMEGKAFAGARRIIRKTEEAGVSFEILEPPHAPEILREILAVSDHWLETKHAREMQFSLGFMAPEYLGRFPLAVARDASGAIIAFLNVLTLRPGAPITFDFMRYRHGAVDNVVDYCIHKACAWGASQGYTELNLGMAPLADVGARRTSRLSERVASLVYRHAERIYNYQGIRAYKTKFHPEWRPRYLAYQSPWQAPETILLATMLIRAVSPADRARIRAAHDAL